MRIATEVLRRTQRHVLPSPSCSAFRACATSTAGVDNGDRRPATHGVHRRQRRRLRLLVCSAPFLDVIPCGCGRGGTSSSSLMLLVRTPSSEPGRLGVHMRGLSPVQCAPTAEDAAPVVVGRRDRCHSEAISSSWHNNNEPEIAARQQMELTIGRMMTMTMTVNAVEVRGRSCLQPGP